MEHQPQAISGMQRLDRRQALAAGVKVDATARLDAPVA
jgi:hypothetical protein